MAEIVPPGGIIGILGGGQLGRMLALAAARLGLECHIYCPEADSPAFQVTRRHTVAPYEDREALRRFAESVDAITLEFESIPFETADFVSRIRPLRPSPKALAITQDRLLEKDFCTEAGCRTAPYASVASAGDLAGAVARIGRPAILKTRRFGYDGKGQARIDFGTDLQGAWNVIGGQPAILEGFVPFEREVSVVAARALDGTVAAYDVTENEHRHHILHRSVAPAALEPALAEEALATARRLLAALDYVGVLAIEMFVLPEKTRGPRLLVNELAPRVHNSGHWTLDGAATSQFEQHVRAVAGWPLGATTRHGPVEMINLIGADIEAWLKLAAEPGTALHLYGKAEPRPGRKMGHLTRLLKQS